MLAIILVLVGVLFWGGVIQINQTSLSNQSVSSDLIDKQTIAPMPHQQMDAELWQIYQSLKQLVNKKAEPCTPWQSPDEERLIREATALMLDPEFDPRIVKTTVFSGIRYTKVHSRQVVHEYGLQRFPQLSETMNPALKGLSIEAILKKVKSGEITTGLRTHQGELALNIIPSQLTKELVDDIKEAGIPLGAQFFQRMLPSPFYPEDLYQSTKEAFMYAFADADLSQLRYDPIVLNNTDYLHKALALTGDIELIEFALDRGLPAFEKPYHSLANAVLHIHTYYVTDSQFRNPHSLTSEALIAELEWLAKRGIHPTDLTDLKRAREALEKHPGKFPAFEDYLNNLTQFEDVEQAKADIAADMDFIKDKLRLHESDLQDFKPSVTQRTCENREDKFNQKRAIVLSELVSQLDKWIKAAESSGKSDAEIEEYISQTSGLLVGLKRRLSLKHAEQTTGIQVNPELKPILYNFHAIQQAYEKGVFSSSDINSKDFMYPVVLYYVFSKNTRKDAHTYLKAIKAMGGEIPLMLEVIQLYAIGERYVEPVVYELLEEWGVDLALESSVGYNSFYTAIIENRDLKLAKYLHSKGVPVVSDPLLDNPLETAMMTSDIGTPEVIKYLRSLGLTNRMEDKQ